MIIQHLLKIVLVFHVILMYFQVLNSGLATLNIAYFGSIGNWVKKMAYF